MLDYPSYINEPYPDNPDPVSGDYAPASYMEIKSSMMAQAENESINQQEQASLGLLASMMK